MGDLQILQSHIQTCFDLNGDGKVNTEDAKIAISLGAVCATMFLSPLPAHAKGGGGGGQTSYSSTSYDRSSYPEFKRPHHPILFPIDLSPNVCPNLPEQDESIDVLVDKFIVGRGMYTRATVVQRGSDTCKFTAVRTPPARASTTNTGTDLAKEYNKPVTLSASRNYETYLAWSILLGMMTIGNALISLYDYLQEISAVTHSKFDSLPIPDKTFASAPNGMYKGGAYEIYGWSKTYQQVETKLEFRNDGTMYGKGTDSIDGDYSIKGHWKALDDGGYLLHWKERYVGFTVKVQCEMKSSMVDDVKFTTIEGTFKSSRNISGTLSLTSSRDFKKMYRFWNTI